jgi:hypothetical protein
VKNEQMVFKLIYLMPLCVNAFQYQKTKLTHSVFNTMNFWFKPYSLSISLSQHFKHLLKSNCFSFFKTYVTLKFSQIWLYSFLPKVSVSEIFP